MKKVAIECFFVFFSSFFNYSRNGLDYVLGVLTRIPPNFVG